MDEELRNKMRYGGLPPETLIISGWSSECNNCGENCDPSSKTHDVVLGYTDRNGDPGCGIEWKYVYSGYGVDMAKSMRPDLEVL